MEPPKKRHKPSNFRIEIPADDNLKETILSKLQVVRETLGHSQKRPVNNADIICHLLEEWTHRTKQSTSSQQSIDSNRSNFTSYQTISKESADEQLFIVAMSSINKFIEIVDNHSRICPSSLTVKKISPRDTLEW